VELRIHPVGVVVVRTRTPVASPSWSGLAAAGRSEQARHQRIFERVRRELDPARLEPYQVQVEPETYVAYCLHEAPPVEEILERHREDVASLVTGEPAGRLAPQVVDAALKHTFRYYRDDLVVVGWDNALLVGRPGDYEDALDVLELANLLLLEFRTYDAFLDQRLEESFDALDRLWRPGGLFRSARSTLREISGIRVDFARLTDNLHDTGKVYGEWYLAKLYRHLRDSFHLASWERAVASKMETLEDMFQLAEEEASHRRSLLLETMIVLLFVLDLVLIWMLGTA
jgi:hypothetical protein